MIDSPAGSADGAPGSGLWLGTLQRIAARAAHEVKNSLNGVAVNLEVVRSRTARAGQTTDAVARFADSAAEQFERVSEQADALLTLARPPREPCDVSQVMKSLHALLGGIVLQGTERAAMVLESLPPGVQTRADGAVVRTVLGETVLAAIEQAVPLAVRVEEGEGGVVMVVVRCADEEGDVPSLAPAVEAIAAGEGVRLERRERTLALHFPESRPSRQPTGP